MKQTLSYQLWTEPGIPLPIFISKYPSFIKTSIAAISSLLQNLNLQLVYNESHHQTKRKQGIWSQQADTMIGLKRLDNIQYCVEQIIKNKTPGDLIETGVWRGGATIFMRAILKAYGITNRQIFVADSFAGLPPPDKQNYPQDKNSQYHKEKFLAIPLEQVKHNFEKYGLLDKQVIFLPGWFNKTLPNAPIKKLSLMRLDGDMYQSTMDGLVNLYPKLSKGGFCIIDDYGHLPSCKQAVDDYRHKHNITNKIKKIDWTGVFWQK